MTAFQKFIVKAYRYLAVAILSSVLAAGAGYLGIVVFYSFNSTWGAPVILTKSSPRILSMTAEVIRARQSLATARGQVSTLEAEIQALSEQRLELAGLAARYERALGRQKSLDGQLATNLDRLAAGKRLADARMARSVSDARKLETAVDQELDAGLITAEMAARVRAQAVVTESTLSSGQLQTASLEHQRGELRAGVRTLEGGADSPKALEFVALLSSIRNDMSDMTLRLNQAKRDLTAKSADVGAFEEFLTTLTRSPYFRTAESGQPSHDFAFVPYYNKAAAVTGAPVYSCWAQVLLCSKVGQVRAVTDDEEKGRHPVFQRDIRGHLVELELTDVEAAREGVLFFGRAPLFL